jgi:hypothetical protein
MEDGLIETTQTIDQLIDIELLTFDYLSTVEYKPTALLIDIERTEDIRKYVFILATKEKRQQSIVIIGERELPRTLNRICFNFNVIALANQFKRLSFDPDKEFDDITPALDIMCDRDIESQTIDDESDKRGLALSVLNTEDMGPVFEFTREARILLGYLNIFDDHMFISLQTPSMV